MIVTRPVGSGRALRRRILAAGGTALSLPGLAVRGAVDSKAAQRALGAARTADIAIFISPVAVRSALALQPRLRFARGSVLCAVGAATARALARAGVGNAVWPQARQDSEGVLDMPELARLRGKRIALIGAPGGRELLPQALRARGAKIEKIDVYRRAAPRLDRRHFDAIAQATPPLLTLVSSLQILANLRALLPPAAFSRLTAGDIVVSSARIGALARSMGFARVHIAQSAETGALVDAAITALALHRL
ncbi:MAG: uroporphyrinogen-III synthase [Rudaea sp.]|nr:uroporphyrinogen-III synthase [Rudaea sp.]